MQDGVRDLPRVAAVLAVGFCLCLLFPCTAGAEGGTPAWHLAVTGQPTNFAPGAAGRQGFLVIATNVGGGDTEGEITVTDSLPPNLLPAAQEERCEAQARHVSCSFKEVVHPGGSIVVFVPAIVSGSPGAPRPNLTTIFGGGAPGVKTTTETEVGSPPPPYGFLDGPAGLRASLSDSAGTPVTRAGATPFELVVDLGFPTEMVGSELLSVGHPKDVRIDLPQGLSLDPAAVPRCREAQLEREACPVSSQVGVVGLAVALQAGSISFESVPLYNLVPPPGSASSFGFVSAGAPVLLLGSVRPGEYNLSAQATDLVARFPVLAMQLQLWGDPLDLSHGVAVQPQSRPLMALPSACGPLELTAHTDSWENPGSFVSRLLPIASLSGEPIEVEGCSGLEFHPSLVVQPTTAVADSPAGLESRIEVPQLLGPEGSATSSLRSATVSLPPGMVINPAAAGGGGVCTPAQIGLESGGGEPTPRFDAVVATCPDASKLGTVEAVTPLQDELEGGQLFGHPLTGAIYLAQPRENPYGSMFALYAAIADPAMGIVVKLAGEVAADPVTGQLTATFDDLPELPFEEFKFDFFGGSRAPLRTPALCGDHLSQAAIAPWSGSAAIKTESHFSIAVSPTGGTCAAAADELPNAPHFDAGTVAPAAGSFSPFVLNLSRRDGSQEIGGLNVTLPAGLVGRLTGSSRCSDTALATAAAKSGEAETASPSCPASSRLGRVLIDLGAGSRPYQEEGTVYLAGSYRGAPLSLAVVVPAVAGPFDLGTVVVRAEIGVDPTTGQISVKSNSLPSMLDGVPLDIRTVRLELDKPELIRNPTSCEPGAVRAKSISVRGQVAALSSHFQVGNCAALTFRPKLLMRLSGSLGRNGHPTVRAILRTDPDGAALKSASFALPAGELLDLMHFRGFCAPEALVRDCPSASRLGSVRIDTPMLEAPLEGSVYLRTPRHRLPDLVAEVHSGELRFLLHGATSDAKGRIRVALQALPDIPLSRAILTLAGGRRGLLVNSRSLCRRTVGKAAAAFTAHDGMRFRLRAPVRPDGCR